MDYERIVESIFIICVRGTYLRTFLILYKINSSHEDFYLN